MIYQLCNIGHEQNDTFFKVCVIRKSSLSDFNYLTSDSDIHLIITSIPESSDVIIADLLPENLNITANNRINDNGLLKNISANFLLTPLDKNLQALLSGYQNQEVVLLLLKNDITFVYGTVTSPLIFSFTELHSNQAQGQKGYTIRISGSTLGDSKQFESLVFDIFNRGLAFELAGSL